MKSRKLKSEIKEIPAEKLKLDPKVQREQTPARLKYMEENLDLDAIGVLTVSDRGRGRYFILDGQHRWQALMNSGLGEWPVRCHVYAKLTTAEEAQLFRDLNNTKRRSAWDDFSKGVLAGDPECVAVTRIVEDAGLTISDQKTDGSIRAVVALTRTYRSANGHGESLLANVLAVAQAAWGNQADAFDGHIIAGIGRLLLTHDGEVDREALAQKLSKIPGGPAGLIGRAQARREFEGGAVAANVMAVAVSTYNKGRRSGALAV